MAGSPSAEPVMYDRIEDRQQRRPDKTPLPEACGLMRALYWQQMPSSAMATTGTIMEMGYPCAAVVEHWTHRT